MTRAARRKTDFRQGHRVRVDKGDAEPVQPQLLANQPSQPPQQKPIFHDSSGPLFSLYSEIAKEEDNKMTDLWQQDATDGILVFTGLFSAALAALLTVSVQDLRPNSQDISAFYLGNIYQVLVDPNVTAPRTSIPSTIAVPPPFSPPRYAIWVNSLWFLSLVISFTCALLAMLLRQWARRYIRVTQPARCSPHKRARRRAFFAGGVDKMGVPLVVEGLPTMLHLSLFLFFAGLVIFLFNVNHSVYLPVIWWVGLFSMVYGCITFVPLFWHHSPYYTPLSIPASLVSVPILTVILAVVNLVLFCLVWIGVALYATFCYCFTWIRMAILSCTMLCDGSRLPVWHQSGANWRWFTPFPYRLYLQRLFIEIWLAFLRWPYGIRNIGKTAEEIASKRSSEIDLGILEWTIGALGEDDKLEKFLEAIPGFFNSHVVKNLERPLPDQFRSKFVGSLCGFLGRNLLSNSVNEEVKTRRLVICMNASNEICHSRDIDRILFRLSSLPFDKVPQSIHTAEILARWFTSGRRRVSPRGRKTVAGVLLCVQERDDAWITLAEEQYGLPKRVLEDHVAHGDDSVLLAILNHMTRQVIRTDIGSWIILSSLSKFNILDTDPGLQDEFCCLWNEVVLKARGRSHPYYIYALHSIRHLYIALHQSPDAAPTAFSSTDDNASVLFNPRWYPLCNISTHHPNPTVRRLTLTQLDSPHHASPYQSRWESQPTPIVTISPRQAKDANIILGLPSSPDSSRPHSPEFPNHTTTNRGSLSTHDNTHGSACSDSIPMEVSRPVSQSMPSTPDIVQMNLPSEDHQLYQNRL